MTIMYQFYFGLSLTIALLLKDVFTLKSVVLTIEPKIVQRLHNSTLRCSYDLEGDVLYSVKWYRGSHEFYRFTPSELPSSKKVFPFAGIVVDVHNSNSTQVMLRNIEFNLSGNFTCEVTTDAPFSTGTDSQTMSVVQLPDFPPAISVGRDPLDYGDTLRANCSSPPSRPPASMEFLLNNISVASSRPLTPRKQQELSWSDLSLEMILSEFHFSHGRLILRCVAQVENVYFEEAVLELDSAREPVPERVSAFDSADCVSVKKLVQLIVLCYVLIICS